MEEKYKGQYTGPEIDRLLGRIDHMADEAVAAAEEVAADAGREAASEYVEGAKQSAEEAKASADTAKKYEEAARETVKTPAYIGENGNWYVFDQASGEYVDSGYSSKGTSAGIVKYVDSKLEAANWKAYNSGLDPDAYIYDLEAKYPIKNNDIEVKLQRKGADFNKEYIEAWAKALIIGDGITSNKLYAYGEKPKIDIPVLIKVVSYN